MEYDMGGGAAALRAELRRLVRENVLPDFLGAFTDDPADLDVAQRFCHLLGEQGLLCLAWPEAYGGRGVSPREQTVVREEMWAHHEPRGAQYTGVNWVGPAIMRHGTPERRRRHLPPIARGDVVWCQGFSEPDAGSDLASLRTAARRDGDGWRIFGQKIWTSYATMAQWCFLLARTATGERKQHGITVFLVPMDDPAIEVRPIACMLGPHQLNEVFLDDLWVTEADVLGTVGEGWKVVQEVLAFERVGIARYARCEGRPGDAAAYRIAVTRLDQDSAEVLADIVALAAPGGEEGRRFARAVDDHRRYSVSATVAPGSIEMQRILLARALLAAS